MPLVKKSQMSSNQINDLANFKSALSGDDWVVKDSFESFFESDMFVPVQASFRKKTKGLELAARYSANSGSEGDHIMLDYTSDDDYKTVEVSFDDTSISLVNFVKSSFEKARREGIRLALEEMISLSFTAKVNFYDSYLPLNQDSLNTVYNHKYEEE